MADGDLPLAGDNVLLRDGDLVVEDAEGVACLVCYHQAYECEGDAPADFWAAQGDVTEGDVFAIEDVCYYWGPLTAECPGTLVDLGEIESFDDCETCEEEYPPLNDPPEGAQPIPCLECPDPPIPVVLRLRGQVCGPGCQLVDVANSHDGGGAFWQITIPMTFPGVIPVTPLAIDGGTYYANTTLGVPDCATSPHSCFVDAYVTGEITCGFQEGIGFVYGGFVLVVSDGKQPDCVTPGGHSVEYLCATFACVDGVMVPTIVNNGCYSGSCGISEIHAGQGEVVHLTDI